MIISSFKLIRILTKRIPKKQIAPKSIQKSIKTYGNLCIKVESPEICHALNTENVKMLGKAGVCSHVKRTSFRVSCGFNAVSKEINDWTTRIEWKKEFANFALPLICIVTYCLCFPSPSLLKTKLMHFFGGSVGGRRAKCIIGYGEVAKITLQKRFFLL